MNMDNTELLMSKPDVCRCCLSTSGSWDMTATYLTENGIKEVYADMLRECYGINCAYLTEWGLSRMVCRQCVAHLRDAFSFRKQVLNAVECFATFHRNKTDLNPVVIKTELGQSGDACFIETGVNREGYGKEAYKEPYEENINFDKNSQFNTNLFKAHTSHKRKRHNSVLKSKLMSLNADEDGIDSDTPISELSKKIRLKIVTNNIGNSKLTELTESMSNDNINTMIIDKGSKYTKNIVKQVSERKRVILTCDAVLRDTTACPFRHHKSWFQCFYCQQDFMEINLLRQHTLTTHANIDEELKKIKRFPRSLQIEISKLECRHCDLNLTDVITMCRHFIDVHDKCIYKECIADYKVNSSPYCCHLCTQQFHVFRTLTTHLNEHYANCICDVCGKGFLNSKRLKVHKRTHESGQFPCNECGKILKTKTSKANHMESAHFKRILKCQICFKPMKHYNDRIKHMSDVHDITHKFKCPICSREYNIKHYLATHIRQTHGHKNKKCSECNMAFITNHGLKKHMSKHTGVKPFSCTVCCKTYARSYTLREHMRVHEVNRRCLDPE